jgi:hypothetical protein
MDINRYNKIVKNKPRVRYNIETIIPRPSDKDYNRGYIKRYFVQKVNDKGSPIYEVDSSTKNYYNAKAQFSTTELKWRISGPTLPQYDSKGVVIDKPVSDSNRIAIQLVAHIIPNLKLYLPNLLQFYKK